MTRHEHEIRRRILDKVIQGRGELERAQKRVTELEHKTAQLNAEVLSRLDVTHQAYALELQGIDYQEMRQIFRQVCYVRNFTRHLCVRDAEMLKAFGHALEFAAATHDNWVILWPSALMLVAKFKLLPAPICAGTNQPNTPNERTHG